MSVKPIPDHYPILTPYLVVKEATQAIEFYQQAFGAKERMRLPNGDKIGHAELELGDSLLMLADECPEMGARAPVPGTSLPVSLVLYVEDADATFNAALAAGAKELRPLANQFYGDRTGMLTDPFGHTWTVATHVEDVSPAEMQKRMAALSKEKTA